MYHYVVFVFHENLFDQSLAIVQRVRQLYLQSMVLQMIVHQDPKIGPVVFSNCLDNEKSNMGKDSCSSYPRDFHRMMLDVYPEVLPNQRCHLVLEQRRKKIFCVKDFQRKLIDPTLSNFLKNKQREFITFNLFLFQY